MAFNFGKGKNGKIEERQVKANELPMPEGIDFSQLWLDPNEGGSLATILSGVAAAASVISLIVSVVK